MKIPSLFLLAALGGSSFNLSCSSDSASGTQPVGTGGVGGPVVGPTDAHCEGLTPVTVEPAACDTPEAEPDGEGGASGGDSTGESAGGSDCNLTHDDEYGATLPNAEGDDDDCKYHASWTSTPIRVGEDVTVTVTSTNLITGEGLQALPDGKQALTRIELYQPCDPSRFGPAQNNKPKFEQVAAGVYRVGPLRFDQSGRWVMRFHFYEQCLDGEGSPHGHVAFFVDVP